jgi:dihydroorotate dehydrogenase
VFEGPGLIGAIKSKLADTMDSENCETLEPLIGKRAGEWAERELPEVVV